MSVPDSLPMLVADDPSESSIEVGTSDRRSRDVSLLWIAIAVLVLSFTLRIRTDQRLELPGVSGLPTPEMCGSRMWFGIECPGCGLTRGFIRLAAGDWSAAVALNRVSPLMAFAVLAQIPYRLGVLLRWSPACRFVKSRWPSALGWVLIVALIGNWLLKLLGV